MFSLIITVISIALVAALALATIYYGGSSFNRGSADARATQYLNEAQQISAAYQLYLTDTTAAGTTAETPSVELFVSKGYLSQAPQAWQGLDTDLSGSVLRGVEGQPTFEVCNVLETRAGRPAFVSEESIPAWEGSDAKNLYGCYRGESLGIYYKL